ncbi:hypothetical protein C4565_09825 [Candidatus Parcubacteria bacterium]|nr:MAG: hypothetical protein C4565_09825 [Candidatus Parcubacteria bacterium]
MISIKSEKTEQNIKPSTKDRVLDNFDSILMQVCDGWLLVGYSGLERKNSAKFQRSYIVLGFCVNSERKSLHYKLGKMPGRFAWALRSLRVL